MGSPQMKIIRGEKVPISNRLDTGLKPLDERERSHCLLPLHHMSVRSALLFRLHHLLQFGNDRLVIFDQCR